MKKITNVTIGADPEVFIANTLLGGEIVPAYMFIVGTKEDPQNVSTDIEGLKLQYDNVSAEYNIPACKNTKEWLKYHNFMLNYIRDTITKPNGLEILINPSVEITKEVANQEIAKTFGCSPSWCVWDMSINKVEPTNHLLRVGGGHLHIGYDNPDKNISFNLIKMMDLYLGVPAILLDNDTARKELYGKAGEFRLCNFGVEYRTLSNFWLQSNELMLWVWESTMAAIEAVNIGREITNPETIVKCINTYDRRLALEILDDYNIKIPDSVSYLIQE